VLRGARADVTDFFYMTLMDKSVVKHNMLSSLHAVRLKVLVFFYSYISQCANWDIGRRYRKQ
jgi:hypothetical protein